MLRRTAVTSALVLAAAFLLTSCSPGSEGAVTGPALPQGSWAVDAAGEEAGTPQEGPEAADGETAPYENPAIGEAGYQIIEILGKTITVGLSTAQELTDAGLSPVMPPPGGSSAGGSLNCSLGMPGSHGFEDAFLHTLLTWEAEGGEFADGVISAVTLTGGPDTETAALHGGIALGSPGEDLLAAWGSPDTESLNSHAGHIGLENPQRELWYLGIWDDGGKDYSAAFYIDSVTGLVTYAYIG